MTIGIPQIIYFILTFFSIWTAFVKHGKIEEIVSYENNNILVKAVAMGFLWLVYYFGGSFHTFGLVQGIITFKLVITIIDDVNTLSISFFRSVSAIVTEIFLLYEAGFFGQR